MKSFLNLITFLLLLNYCRADFCQYNFSVHDLQSSVIDEVMSFIGKGLIQCKDTRVISSNINFWVYTRDAPSGRKLDSLDPQMSNKKTIFLIPGWLCNITNDLMPELKDAYLIKYDANVIIVDWSIYAAGTYGDAYCRVPNIAKTIADFILRLEINLAINVDTVHIVGHSMGGQLAGLAGQHLKKTYNRKLYRITGLDPAGPLYGTNGVDERLDKSDANFVDVIHTNGGLLGYAERCGHADYYPGCTGSQKGCPFDFSNLLSIDFLIGKIGCDHLRAVDYMIESINRNDFKAEEKVFLCFSNSDVVSYMGEYSIKQWGDHKYILNTNPTKPYGQG